MWAQHLQVWEVHSSQCASLSLITKATDLLIKPLLFPCCIDTVAFHKYKMFPSLHEDASCCYTEHLKHLTSPGQKKWQGGGEWDAAPDPVRTTGGSWQLHGRRGHSEGQWSSEGRAKGVRVCIFWSRGVVCSRWQLIPHAGGRLSRQADQKVKAPGGPPFEMGMGPRYQTENISKLPATEQLHIHGWDWR